MNIACSNLSQIHFHCDTYIDCQIMLNNFFLHEYISDQELANNLLVLTFEVQMHQFIKLLH